MFEGRDILTGEGQEPLASDQPQTFGEVFLTTSKLYKKHFIFFLGLIVFGVAFFVFVGVTGVVLNLPQWPPESPVEAGSFWAKLPPWVKLAISAGFILAIYVQWRVLAFSVFATSEFYQGREVRLWQFLPFRQKLAVRWFLLWYAAGLLFGQSWVGIPFELLAKSFLAMGFPATILEGLDFTKAFRRTSELNKEAFFRMGGWVVISGVFSAGVFYTFPQMITFLEPLVGPAWGVRLGFILLLSLPFFITQFLLLLIVISYFDQRVRLEGWAPPVKEAAMEEVLPEVS